MTATTPTGERLELRVDTAQAERTDAKPDASVVNFPAAHWHDRAGNRVRGPRIRLARVRVGQADTRPAAIG